MCAFCHGAKGEGYVADQAPAIGRPAFLAAATDDFLRAAIADGRKGTTMSAWSSARSGPLTREDIEAVITHMRTWYAGPPAVLDERTLKGDAERGAQLYEKECVRCHGARGVGGPNVHIGNPGLLASASHGFLRDAIAKGRPHTTMPTFEAKLGVEGVEDLVALLRTFQTEVQAAPPRDAPPPPLPLGPLPINPEGPEPHGFVMYPKMVTVDAVKAQLDKGARLALLDARPSSDYLTEHIAGAVSVPFYDPKPYFKDLPKNTWLVCYCACPHAESGRLAMALQEQGFKKVTVLDEGLNVWRGRGYGMNSGAQP